MSCDEAIDSQRLPIMFFFRDRCIQDAYCSLRQKQDARTLPVTARLLETLVRLSTASAITFLGQLLTLLTHLDAVFRRTLDSVCQKQSKEATVKRP